MNATQRQKFLLLGHFKENDVITIKDLHEKDKKHFKIINYEFLTKVKTHVIFLCEIEGTNSHYNYEEFLVSKFGSRYALEVLRISVITKIDDEFFHVYWNEFWGLTGSCQRRQSINNLYPELREAVNGSLHRLS